MMHVGVKYPLSERQKVIKEIQHWLNHEARVIPQTSAMDAAVEGLVAAAYYFPHAGPPLMNAVALKFKLQNLFDNPPQSGT
jgi:hypothetical protein